MGLLKIVASAVVLISLWACGGGGGSPGSNPNQPTFTTTAPASLELEPGTSASFQIVGGTPPYTAASPNAAIAVGGVSGNQLTIGAVSRGSTSISVLDFSGKSVSVPVKVNALVPLAIDAPAAVTVQRGAENARAFALSGGIGPFAVSVTDSRALFAAVSGRTLTLTGLNVSPAVTVSVQDATGASATLSVTVAGNIVPLFTTAPTALQLKVGASAGFAIGGGTPPYTIVSSAPAVVAATPTLTTGAYTIQGVASGAGALTIRDSENSAPLSVAVTVANLPLAVAPTAGTGRPGDSLTFLLSGGVPTYSLTVSNPAVASAELDGTNRVKVRLLATGAAQLTISDAEGKTVAVSLTVAIDSTRSFQLSPSALTIPETYTATIPLLINGGAAPFATFTNSTTLTSASVNADNTAVNVGLGSQGTRCVGANTVVRITVIDKLGAVAVSDITVADGLTCP